VSFTQSGHNPQEMKKKPVALSFLSGPRLDEYPPLCGMHVHGLGLLKEKERKERQALRVSHVM